MLYDLGARARPVYEVLLDRIRSGELAPGTRLPPHTRLAETFGVAPLTVRQVLARLEADGLLVREHGRGTFVRAAQGSHILIVTSDPVRRADLVDQVREAGRGALLAATPAEGMAALGREPSLSLVVLDLRLPDPSDGLRFARRLRERQPGLPIAVLNPTRRQHSRLEHTVAPPLLVIGDPPLDQLRRVLRADVTGAQPGAQRGAQPGPLTGDTTPAAQQPGGLLERYLAFQLAGDRAAARALIRQEGLAAGLGAADLYTQVLQAAQYKVGHLWQCGQISVAREHLATAVTEAVMADIVTAAPRAPSTGIRVLVACVEGELHALGARMVADLLELDGFAVRFLGADVPTDSLLTMIQEEAPRLLVLSAAMADHLAQVRAAVARVRQAHGPGVPIFVGGQVLDWVPDLPRILDVDFAAREASETVGGARRLFVAGAARP